MLSSLPKVFKGLVSRLRRTAAPRDDAIPPEARENADVYMAERRAQLNHWLFLTRLVLIGGLAGYLLINAIASVSTLPPVLLLLGGYVLANAGVRAFGGHRLRCAPWMFAALDAALVVLLRHVYFFGGVVDPDVTMAALFALVLVVYTLYGAPKLNAALSLTALAATTLTIYTGTYHPSIASSLPSVATLSYDHPLRTFLLVEYLSIACLVTCILALRLHRQVISYSVAQYRRMQSAVSAAVERAHRERIEKLDELKRNFIMVVSHELRTPLTPLSSSLSIVASEMEQGRTDREMLGIAQEAADELRDLVDDYVELAQLLSQEGSAASHRNIRLSTLMEILREDFPDFQFLPDGLDGLVTSSDPHLLGSALRAVLRRAESVTTLSQQVTIQGRLVTDLPSADEHPESSDPQTFLGYQRPSGYLPSSEVEAEEDPGIENDETPEKKVVLTVHDPESQVQSRTKAAAGDLYTPSSERLFFAKNTGMELTLAQQALERAGGQLYVAGSPDGGTDIHLVLPGLRNEAPWLDAHQLRALLAPRQNGSALA